MLKQLQQRWKVGDVKIILIFCTFAFGGSLCGFAARKILTLTEINGGIWIVTYFIIATLLWPLSVLLVSIPLGQFYFFKQYLKKLFNKMSGNKLMTLHRIAIFASGAGSNAKKIIDYFENDETVTIALVVCNKPDAGVINIARQHTIDTLIIDRAIFFNENTYVAELKKRGINFIVLAGFLWKVPSSLIQAYPNKIINIHPALLPKFGGKGMYGNFVHEAVVVAGEKESGITIHYVDEQYDHGNIIFQASCPIIEGDTADSVAAKIHLLEHQHYPAIIDSILKSKIAVKTSEAIS